jgi:hypothetical protein
MDGSMKRQQEEPRSPSGLMERLGGSRGVWWSGVEKERGKSAPCEAVRTRVLFEEQKKTKTTQLGNTTAILGIMRKANAAPLCLLLECFCNLVFGLPVHYVHYLGYLLSLALDTFQHHPSCVYVLVSPLDNFNLLKKI